MDDGGRDGPDRTGPMVAISANWLGILAQSAARNSFALVIQASACI